MKTYSFIAVFFLILLAGCGVKKSPTPLYAYPINFETDGPTPTPSPGQIK